MAYSRFNSKANISKQYYSIGSYMSSDTFKEYNIRLKECNRGILGKSWCRGTIHQIVKNEFGTIFTLKNKTLIFKYMDQIHYEVGDQVYFTVIFIENTQDLFIIRFEKESLFHLDISILSLLSHLGNSLILMEKC